MAVNRTAFTKYAIYTPLTGQTAHCEECWLDWLQSPVDGDGDG